MIKSNKEFSELQICLTNQCSNQCSYCHLDKSSLSQMPEAVFQQAIRFALDNGIEWIRLTGGDVFEYGKLKECLQFIKDRDLKVILNIPFMRISSAKELLPSCDIVLISFQEIRQLSDPKELAEISEKVPTMGCIVFQEKWLKDIERLNDYVNNIPFDSFFFLRDVDRKDAGYFMALNTCVERIPEGSRILFSNAFPLCFVSKNKLKICSGRRFDNGNERLYVTQDGRIKPSAYSTIDLGSVDAFDHNSLTGHYEKIARVVDGNQKCRRCRIKDHCFGGIIAHDGYGPDGLISHAFHNKYLTGLQEKIKKGFVSFSPDNDFRLLYHENSSFFMTYPHTEYWNEIDHHPINESLALKDRTLNLYIHFPFCLGSCKFCNVQKASRSLIDEYIDQLINGIEKYRKIISGNEIETIYVGGGSPQFMGARHAERLFQKVFSLIQNDPKEVSFELFPRDYDDDLMKVLEQYVTRISIGIQSFDDRHLARVNRLTNKAEMIDFIAKVRSRKFQKINFDVIYGLYINNPQDFKKDFEEILSLKPDHVTFQPLHFTNEIDYDDDRVNKNIKNAVELNRLGREILESNGFKQNSAEDFSNGPKVEYQNALLRQRNILGLGKGAFSYLNNFYFKEEGGQAYYFKLGEVDRLFAELFLKSRFLTVDMDALDQRYNVDFKTVFSDSIKHLMDQHYITIEKGRLTITALGRNYVDLISSILSLNNLDYKLKSEKDALGVNLTINAPASSSDDIREYNELGVDEIYVGIRTDPARGSLRLINKRNEIGANFMSIDELRQVRFKGKISLTVNNAFMNDSKMEEAKRQIAETRDIVDNYIISDPSLIDLIKEIAPDKGIILSVVAACLNSSAVEYYKKKGIKRIILPRHLTMNEYQEIAQCDMEFEVLILNQFCRNIDGFCSRCHIQEGGIDLMNCDIPFDSQFIPLQPMNGQDVQLMHDNIRSTLKFSKICGICFIRQFMEMGIHHFKIVGRNHPTAKKVADVKLVKKAFEQIDADDFALNCKNIFKTTYKMDCDNRCYY